MKATAVKKTTPGALQNIKDRWDALGEKFNNLEMRERVLISLGVLAAIYMLWDFAFATPFARQQATLQVRYDNANRELQKLTAQEQVLVKALTNDPNAAKRREMHRLEEQLHGIDVQLEQMSVGLIPASDLPVVLRDVLRESSSLELLGLESLQPEKLELAQKPVTDDARDQAVAAAQNQNSSSENVDARLREERVIGVYKHGVRLTLAGDYFSVLAYLQRLEDLPWRLYWDTLEYEVRQYPRARVTLEVYTLSTGKGALGV